MKAGNARPNAERAEADQAAAAVDQATHRRILNKNMRIELERFAYTETETQGRLTVDGFSVYTIEQPWREGPNPGGEPFRSCIPDGDYALVPFTRPNGDKTFAFVNEVLGVFLEPPDGPGRYLCLLHPGNYVHDVQGCVAPGDAMLMRDGFMMVTASRKAFRNIMERIPWTTGHSITIRRTQGAQDGAEG